MTAPLNHRLPNRAAHGSKRLSPQTEAAGPPCRGDATPAEREATAYYRARLCFDLLIIGYGNPLRGDDGFGYRAAERIPGAVAVHQLTPELMDPIARAGRVLFLDAAADGVPGEIRRRELHPSPAGAFTHHATPEALLAGALTLYGRAPCAEILTVCGADFSLSTDLSPAVEAALETVVGLFRTGASPPLAL
jgi:hydrogenase maturation protease